MSGLCAIAVQGCEQEVDIAARGLIESEAIKVSAICIKEQRE